MDDFAIVSTAKKDPTFGLIVGGPGEGKTCLGGLQPDPIFLKVEDGTSSLDTIKKYNPNFKRENVGSFGRVVEKDGEKVNEDIIFDNSSDILKAIGWLRTGKHQRKSLIIDSAPRIEDIFVREVIALETNPKAKSMAAAHGGYTEAWGLVRDMWAELVRHLNLLRRERGMHVFILCHEAFETVERPDVQSYMRSNLQLYPGSKGKPGFDCRAFLIQQSSLVAFLRQEVYVSSDKTKKEIEKNGNVGKVISNPNGRVISCHGEPANVGKNRWGITDLIPYDLSCNPFEQYL